MRSALVATLLAAAVLTPGSITASASAPGPIIHSSANPGRIAPIDIATTASVSPASIWAMVAEAVQL